MKSLIRIPTDVELPLVGCIAFGLIDRGTNLIQVRPISGCNLNCIFCSVDEGENSKTRITSFIVDLDYLIDSFKQLVKFKNVNKIEAHIDGAGEPTLYPKFRDLVQKLREIKEVSIISVQTNGTLLSHKWINELAEIGLSRINLSINSLNPELAKKLSGTDWYNVEKICELAKIIVDTKIDLLIAPVWIPGVNDSDIHEIINFAKTIGCGKKWPPLGIQKYEVHKHGRKIPGIRSLKWRDFYNKLREWENKHGIKLKLTPKDFNIFKCSILPLAFLKNEVVSVKVKCQGWMFNQVIGVSRKRCMTIIGSNTLIGSSLKVKIIHNKHNIYIAKPI